MKIVWLMVVSFALGAQGLAQDQKLPKVVLLGDSIRLGYEAGVKKKLAGIAQVISDPANGQDSANELDQLEAWAIKHQPDMIHFNAGIHDIKKSVANGQHQVGHELYLKNLEKIVETLRLKTKATIVFATTTPIIDERYKPLAREYNLFNADLEKNNAAAIELMAKLKVPVHDLNRIVRFHESEKLINKDGVHFDAPGNEVLSTAVADCVRRHLTIKFAAPSRVVPGGPKEADNYRQSEAAGDALVSDYYKSLKAPELSIPKDAAAWEKTRPGLKEKVLAALGEMPPRGAKPKSRTVCFEIHPELQLEKVFLDNGVGNEIPALLLLPKGESKPRPGVLWLHSSGRDTTDLLTPNRNGGEEPLGPVLVKEGYAVLGLDNWWHGERAGTGPAGSREKANDEQQSLHKLNLLLGRTLWGMYVRDDQVALDYFCSRPEVDRKRIGATGMSMGSTRAWWLAAIDERIQCTVGISCLTRYENLIKHGQLRQHGVYYYCFGLMKHCDTEGVIALVSPRPCLFLSGDLDAGSPVDGIKIIEEKVSSVYRAQGADKQFKNIIYPNTGHVHSPDMRAETIKWFNQWLKK